MTEQDQIVRVKLAFLQQMAVHGILPEEIGRLVKQEAAGQEKSAGAVLPLAFLGNTLTNVVGKIGDFAGKAIGGVRDIGLLGALGAGGLGFLAGNVAEGMLGPSKSDVDQEKRLARIAALRQAAIRTSAHAALRRSLSNVQRERRPALQISSNT